MIRMVRVRCLLATVSAGGGGRSSGALQLELWPQKNAEVAKTLGLKGWFLRSLRSLAANIRSGKSPAVFLKML
jgi:hypothetical protein